MVTTFQSSSSIRVTNAAKMTSATITQPINIERNTFFIINLFEGNVRVWEASVTKSCNHCLFSSLFGECDHFLLHLLANSALGGFKIMFCLEPNPESRCRSKKPRET